jgi:hypothetical protein
MSRSASRAAANNRANQMNPNNGAFWRSRGPGTPAAPNPPPPARPPVDERQERAPALAPAPEKAAPEGGREPV